MNLLALQDTYIQDFDSTDILEKHFGATSSIWSKYCGLVNFSQFIHLDPLFITRDGRGMWIRVTHVHNTFTPFNIFNIYAPANPHDRFAFFNQQILLIVNQPSIKDQLDETFIMGDFNYSYSSNDSSFRSAPKAWRDFLHDHFINLMLPPDQSTMATTFHGPTGSSSIDYIFSSSFLAERCAPPTNHFINPHWTDHCMISTSFRYVSLKEKGHDIWRANPLIINNKTFRQQLSTTLSEAAPQILAQESRQTAWDELKSIVQSTCRQFSRHAESRCTKQEKHLQRLRNKMLRHLKETGNRPARLDAICTAIAEIQEEKTKILQLKASVRWREKSEKCARYLKQTAETRLVNRCIDELKDPTTGQVDSSLNHLHQASSSFYSNLYTTEHIDDNAISDLLDHIPNHVKLQPEEQEFLTLQFTIDDILMAASRAPKQSSPGLDGLPYQVLYLVFKHPKYQDLITQIYNNALTKALFPPSWKESYLCLLPKQGDLSLLKNYRPICLINTDSKIFTRLLNTRLVECSNTLINKFQTGFIHGRYIADNGLAVKLTMEHARIAGSHEDIGLSVDMEKAYDKIHPVYLDRCLDRWGFPTCIRQSITNLFFSTNMRININGFLSNSFKQQRGVRQGDPLSPVLFNLALEPLLSRILHDDSITGYQLPATPLHNYNINIKDPTQLKILAYADDCFVFIHNLHDLQRTMLHIETYSLASNATINKDKTHAISLSGSPSSSLRTHLESQGIRSWFDQTSEQALVYLGYPLYHTPRQRDRFLDQLIQKIKSACDIHSQRSLSIRGRATIVNVLILSTLWHVLRVCPVPKSFFEKVRSVCHTFLTRRMWPKVAYYKMVDNRNKGGLAILHPSSQQSALQLRWIIPLFNHQDPTKSFIHDWIYNIMLQWSDGQDPLMVLLFPYLRTPTMKSPVTFIKSLCDTMDHLNLDLTTASLPINTILQMHIIDVIGPIVSPITFKLHKFLHHIKLTRLRIDNLYILNTQSGFVRRRESNEFHQPFRRFLMSIDKKLEQGELGIASLILQALFPPPIYTGGSNPAIKEHNINSIAGCCKAQGILLTDLNTKDFRQVIVQKFIDTQEKHHTSEFLLNHKSWSQFWNMDIRYQARNFWFRILHKKLSCRKVLHQLLPTEYPSPLCPICSSAIDDDRHFIYRCPNKWRIWKEILQDLLPIPISYNDVENTVYHLNFPTNPPQISSPIIVATILEYIWKAHWQFIFNFVPFVPQSIITRIHSSLIQRNMEKDIPNLVL